MAVNLVLELFRWGIITSGDEQQYLILVLASAPCLEPEKCNDISGIEGEQQYSTPAFDVPAPCWPDKRHGYYPEHQGYRYLSPIY